MSHKVNAEDKPSHAKHTKEPNEYVQRSAKRNFAHCFDVVMKEMLKIKGGINEEDEGTSDVELRRCMKNLGLEPHFVGIRKDFDRMQDDIRPGKTPFGIFNTASTGGGVHWFACYDGVVYDPFGDDRSKTQEQPYSEDTCGERCIAWLLMCNLMKYPVWL